MVCCPKRSAFIYSKEKRVVVCIKGGKKERKNERKSHLAWKQKEFLKMMTVPAAMPNFQCA